MPRRKSKRRRRRRTRRRTRRRRRRRKVQRGGGKPWAKNGSFFFRIQLGGAEEEEGMFSEVPLNWSMKQVESFFKGWFKNEYGNYKIDLSYEPHIKGFNSFEDWLEKAEGNYQPKISIKAEAALCQSARRFFPASSQSLRSIVAAFPDAPSGHP